jgi:serine/threonine-protein kinase
VAWQAQRAEREAVRANAIKDFLIGLFEQSNPRTGKPTVDMSARELLDFGRDRADAAFANDPATEIELLNTFGNIYDSLSDKRAEDAWGRRLELARKLYGPSDPRTVDAAIRLVSTLGLFQDEDRARALLDDIRGPVFSRFGAESLERAEWLSARADALRDAPGGRTEAIADDEAAIAIFEKHFPDEAVYSDAVFNLSGYQYDAEQYAASIASAEKARAIMVARHEFDAMEELMYHSDVAGSLGDLGHFKEADAQLALEQTQAERQLGRQSLWYIHAVTARASLASVQGDWQRAETLYQSLLSDGSLGKANPTGLPNSARRAYGAALAREGRAAQSIPILEAALAATKIHRHDEVNLRRTEQQLGDAYDQVGRTAEARAMLKAARDEFLQYGNPGGEMTLNAEERWGRFLLDHGDSTGAAHEFGAILQQAGGKPCAAAAMALAGLARIALASGDLASADRRSADAMAKMAASTTSYDVRLRVDTALVRAQVLLALGRRDEARTLAAEAVENAKLWYAPGAAQIGRAVAVLEAAS